MLHFAFANQVLDRTGDVFDRNVGIDAVLVEEIDPIGLEARQRRLGYLADVLGSAIEPSLLPVLEPEPELRRNDDLIPNRRERFANDLFIRERAVRSAVSKKVTPPSTAARITARPSARLVATP